MAEDQGANQPRGEMARDQGASALQLETARRFASAGEAQTELFDAFNAWTEILTNRSIEVGYAIIAANWAAHGSTNAILTNPYARWSLLTALAFLALHVTVVWWMAALLRRRIDHAQQDFDRWNREFREAQGRPLPWPYTAGIERLAVATGLAKAFIPLIAGILFITSLFT